MDVLLIQPEKLPGVKETRSSIPLSLIHLAAALRAHGHAPHILDLSTAGVPDGSAREAFIEAACRRLIGEHAIRLVGISCFTTMHFPLVEELSALIRQIDRHLPICIGGAHPTFFGSDILQHNTDIDYVIAGEGEDAFVRLVDLVANSGSEGPDPSGIQSLIYRNPTGQIRENPRQAYAKDIDRFGIPAWDLIDLTKYYGNYQTYYNPKRQDFHLTVPIVTSRSCPFSCSFCSAHLIMGKKYRKRAAASVVDEIEYLHYERGQNYFAFMDDVINIDKKHVLDISEEIHRRNLNIQFSINQGLYLRLVDKEMVDALADAGLVAVSLPIEHGDEYIRTAVLNKKLTDDKIFEVAGYIKNRDIFTVGLFIMGFPEETEQTLERTRRFIVDLGLDVNAVATLIPFPRTKVYEQAVKERLMTVETDDVRDGRAFFDPQNRDRFFIAPRSASLEVLKKYREIFNSMYFFSDRAKKLNDVRHAA